MGNTKQYWNSVAHLEKDAEFVEQAHKEFAEQIPVDEFLDKTDLDEASTSRRDFLKFMGFGLGAATLAACEAPVNKAIPYVVKPEEVTPGVANYYASTFADGTDYASILVRTREGRPILIDGNKLSPVTKGGISARINSSLLSLYDGNRVKGPMKAGAASTWDAIDSDISTALKSASSIRILTPSIISPSTKAAITDFSASFGSEDAPVDVTHVSYDAISNSSILEANQATFGKAILPSYDFSKAKVIVSVAADFLGEWLMSTQYTGQYAEGRNPDGAWMSKHYQFEALMSVTGSNADVRGAVKAGDYGAVVAALYNAIAKKTGASSISAPALSEDDNEVAVKIAEAAEALLAVKGHGLVVSGSDDKNVQIVVNGINQLLGNYGTTIDIEQPVFLKQGLESNVKGLIADMNAGKVDVLLISGVDPVYSMPASWNFAEALSKVKTVVSFAGKANATSELAHFVAPDSNFLESWNDAEPVAGHFSLGQPVIKPLFDTRQFQSSLLTWAGMDADYHAYIQKYWEEHIYPKSGSTKSFSAFWNQSLHDGIATATPTPVLAEVPVEGEEDTASGVDVSSAASKLKAAEAGLELNLYVKTGIGDGSQAQNPWLQELPDPITKVTWDNYITMNPADMRDQGYEINIGQQTEADLATVTAGSQTITLPVIASPGQKAGTIGIAVGYGKGKVGEELIGKNAFPLANGASFVVPGVSIAATGESYPVASTQSHHTMMGRKIVNETTLENYKSQGREYWNPAIEIADAYGKPSSTQKLNLWQDHDIAKHHRWGLNVDLNACTGCSACVTACHIENNVPVVGKDEVRRKRTMFWLRIDRYYSSDAEPARPIEPGQAKQADGSKLDYHAMEVPSKYPQTVHMPLMCQHCNHAPCETVCPVAATTHSNEGLNQMAYNRCVGTRYCANNCPYKVRRFNWFQYDRYHKFTDVNPSQDDYGRLVLNPDVVVRSRGVMEKCSMCVQRIQAAKLEAKKAGTTVQDEDVQTACSSACSTGAIKFGDINDEAHEVAKLASNDRAYHLIEEVGTQPNVWYMTKVRNLPKEEINLTAYAGHGEHEAAADHDDHHEEAHH